MRTPYKRVPRHIAVIPDGNRRWAEVRGWPRERGYEFGVPPGLTLFEEGERLGIEEVSVYGFTQDNTKRPRAQVAAYQAAVVVFVELLIERDASFQVIGDPNSPLFPESLKPYCGVLSGARKPKVNLLVNYGWRWDLETATRRIAEGTARSVIEGMASRDVSRIDLIMRWGGRRRLSGLLPIQSVYADFYVIDALWPDFALEQFHEGLEWYQNQETTLGG